MIRGLEKAKAELETAGYEFVVSANPMRKPSLVRTPDGWIYEARVSENYIFSKDYDTLALIELVEAAQKLEQKLKGKD